MTGFADADVPDGWRVWSDEEDGRAVLVFRPDVFEGERHPPECLPTLYVSRRPPERRMRRGGQRSDQWHVAVTLEPEVRVRELEGAYDTREAAVDGAVEAMRRFAAGDVDLRDVYQVPREAYLDALDDLTGRDG